LTEYLKKNPAAAQELAIVGFSFERGKDPVQINSHLQAYKKEMGIPFEIVYAGAANTTEAERVFPNLNKVMAFPTMIILDKNDRVRRIHTGFDGPATSKYGAFKGEFEALMTELRKDNG
ncbi:MAG: TlpA family protein disulfide reductase, partial [Saprospiraceae bacterium]